MYELNSIKISYELSCGPTLYFGIFNDDKDIKAFYDYFKKIYKRMSYSKNNGDISMDNRSIGVFDSE